jgi:RNA polymerase sigma-70 factor (ECF subfamily)
MDREELLSRFPSHRRRLVVSLSRLVSKPDAEDLANETLLRALAAVGGYRGDATLGTWLHRIGVNLAIDLLRRRKNIPELPADMQELPEPNLDATPPEALERQQTSRCIQRLLAGLPARDRQILVQADMVDQTAHEIARDEGITTGNAKIRLHRARVALKAALEDYCDVYRQPAGVLCCIPKSGAL